MRLWRKVTRPKGETSDGFASVDLNFPRQMRLVQAPLRGPLFTKAVESWDRTKIPTSFLRPCRNDTSEIDTSCTVAAVIEAGVCNPTCQSFTVSMQSE
jgi:hypothetical protein